MIKPNWHGIAKIESFIMAALGLAVLPSLLMCIADDSRHLRTSFATILILCICLSIMLRQIGGRMTGSLDMRDGILVVFLGWITACILGSLPYIASGVLPNPIDAFFESVSGFSTTAVSVIRDIESVPKALQFWRSETQWLGGIGILIVVISLIPVYGNSSDSMLTVETPGGRAIKVSSRSRNAAKLIIWVYCGLTFAEVLLLAAGHVDLFNAVCMSFASTSSAGFSNFNNGLAHYTEHYIHIIVAIFTFFSCISFVIYGYISRREWDNIKHNTELKTFILIIAVSSVISSVSLIAAHTYDSVGTAIRFGVFESIAFATTTGHAAIDMGAWPSFTKGFLTVVSYIGGCSLSTGCGIKVFRFVVIARVIKESFIQRLHPRAVITTKVDRLPLKSNIKTAAISYVMTFIAFLFIGGFIISLESPTIAHALGTSGALLSNTGTSFADNGLDIGYMMFSSPMKLFMCAMMLAGRLEIYSLIMVFTRDFWNLDR